MNVTDTAAFVPVIGSDPDYLLLKMELNDCYFMKVLLPMMKIC